MEPNKNTSQNQNSQNISADIEALASERPSESNTIEVPEISLPKGGGALRGIDEKFQVNPSNGTAGFSIPFPLSPGRNGFGPNLELSYNSGVGNSPFGIGWSLGLISIRRKTEKELPKYQDGTQEDTFVISGMEDLVPFLKQDEQGHWQVKQTREGDHSIKQYRPRQEDDFSKIEKISHPGSGVFWRVTNRDNIVTIYGRSPDCRISDPSDNKRIFEWLPEFSYDNQGNYITFNYKQENLDNIPVKLYEKNRLSGTAPFTNKYLKRVIYGNKTAYYPDPALLHEAKAPDNDPYCFELVFDYGEHHLEKPTPEEEAGQLWDYRKDPFSSYRSSFEIRTNRLCKRVLMFHRFEELNAGVPTLVTSLDFEHLSSENLKTKSNRPAELTYLIGVSQKGYIRRADGSYSVKALPKMTFDYQWLNWNTEVKEVDEAQLQGSPIGLSAPYQWVDLYSEGISGILSEQSQGWFYKGNLGEDDLGKLSFTQTKPIFPKPSMLGMADGRLQLVDLEANGQKQIVARTKDGQAGYFELGHEEHWKPFTSFAKQLEIDLSSPHVRIFDLNGDGRPEIVLSDQGAFYWWENDGKKGYGTAVKAFLPFEEESGPALVFQDQEQRIFLADMCGDGLTDIVRIKNGEVCYWANKGYGHFSAKISMANAPIFDTPELFNPAYLQLVDISGTGVADIIYLGKHQFKAFLNLSGNAWSEPTLIEPFFPTELSNTLTVTDLVGNGTSCLVWSSQLPTHKNAPMKYIDLMGGIKPHIMKSYQNGFGKKTEVVYKSSTKYYLEDKIKGIPWITKLPFPVQCVSQTIVTDAVSGVRFSSQYSYHHGYYDHSEREFRGFGRVEQTDSEVFEVFEKSGASNVVTKEKHQPPVLTKTWFHTGAFLDKQKILSHFKSEYWYEHFKKLHPNINPIEYELPDAIVNVAKNISVTIEDLSVEECREALRSCKGMVLRTEVFALDAENMEDLEQLKKQATPYSVVTHNCQIQLQQPRQGNQHAVFMVQESEAISYAYERNPEDPRIQHSLNIKTDQYGNILESVSVVYPRVGSEDALQDQPDDTLAAREAKQNARAAQKKYGIVFTTSEFTNDILEDHVYLLRKEWRNSSYEITGLKPNVELFTPKELKDLPNLQEIEYHQKPDGNTAQKRLIERSMTKFYDDQLSLPMPNGQQGKWGITFENYQLAYTPNLLQNIFTPSPHSMDFEVSDQDMIDAKYHLEDTAWWVRSGTIQYLNGGENLEDTKNRFFRPLSYTNPMGSKTQAFYDLLFLFENRTVDVLGNQDDVLEFDYRTLTAIRTRDINDNIASVILDELGMVKATAIEGKDNNNDNQGEEADNLGGISAITEVAEQVLIDNFFAAALVEDICDYGQLQNIARQLLENASSRILFNYNQQPTVAVSIIREQHSNININSPLQISFEYSDGFGNIAMTKIQAETGMAKKAIEQEDSSWLIEEVDTENQIRWVGNGRTVLNNKGNPIKQYEPYFSVSPIYENAAGLVESGVSPIHFYDPLGRNIKTEFPNGTFAKVVFDTWKQARYDTNDTVKDSNWYNNRINLPDNDPEKKAALKTEHHHNTPSCLILNTQGLSTLAIDHNRYTNFAEQLIDELRHTHAPLDIEGNVLSLIDVRGNNVMEFSYNMLGQRVTQEGMDTGKRWTLNNVMGYPIKIWDERKYEFTFVYDALLRPQEKWVHGGENIVPINILFEKVIYGEGLTNNKQKNLRGKPAILYDSAGKVITEQYDFKENPQTSTRIFAKDYKSTPNYNIPDLDSLLDSTRFTFTRSEEFDALNRLIKQVQPNGTEHIFLFNQAGLLNQVHSKQEDTISVYVQNIDYDAKGQRTHIHYGNEVKTKYAYDKKTFRLKQLTTTKGTGELLQDLRYTHDPVGNITEIRDLAIPTIFFKNQKISGKNEYTYDSLYQLIKASGREQTANIIDFGGGDIWNDQHAMFNLKDGDPMAMHQYIQRYKYDIAGNILQVKHVAGAHSWTRDYTYQTKNNRLVSTEVGNQTFSYSHHNFHGYITEMPHLQHMQWNFKEELIASSKQKRNDGGTPEITYYVYDGNGQRLRKVTELGAEPEANPQKKDERLYIGTYEVYRHENGLERESIHILDNQRRIAMVDTETEPRTLMGISIGRTTPVKTVRYQLSNHLGSSSLEVDEQAAVISYEEFHPFGTTAYQAKNQAIKAAAKRYRYTGMERDDETGLEYHSARYYIPWLGRWLSSDPISINGGMNLFEYSLNNPLKYSDSSGNQASAACALGGPTPWCGAGILWDVGVWLFAGTAVVGTAVVVHEVTKPKPLELSSEPWSPPKVDPLPPTITEPDTAPPIPQVDPYPIPWRIPLDDVGPTMGPKKKPDPKPDPKTGPDPIPPLGPDTIDDPKEKERRRRKGELHHIASDKDAIYAPKFQDIFEKANDLGPVITRERITLDSPENVRPLIGHKGPHGKKYHEIVLNRLKAGLAGKEERTEEYRTALKITLDALYLEMNIPGTELYKLARTSTWGTGDDLTRSAPWEIDKLLEDIGGITPLDPKNWKSWGCE